VSLNKTIEHYWRSWAALVYLFICIVDFFVAPLIWNLMMADHCATHDCAVEGVTRWEPLTLGAGAMFHLSFGAILGATAWKKKEELEVHTNRDNNIS
jgi:hypothetical protein